MLKAVLFDMDGVLFDTERQAAEADSLAARRMGVEMPPSLVLQLCGVNATLGREIIQGHYGDAFDYERFMLLVREEFEKILEREGVVVKPGVPETLDWLQKNGYHIAIASSSHEKRIRYNLSQSGLAGFFETITGGNMVAQSKPEPDIFKAAAASLSLLPSQCAAVEDSHNGVKSAAAAGCVTVMIPDLLQPTEEMRRLAAAVLPSLHELPAFLQAYTPHAVG